MSLRKWVLPPVLVTLAVGAHWFMDVPRSHIEPRSKKKKKSKKDQRIPTHEQRFEPRNPETLGWELEHWAKKPFIEEPEISGFAGPQREALNRAIRLAESEALSGSPEVSGFRHEVECRSVRCRAWLCGHAWETELVEDALASLQLGEETAWALFDTRGGEPPDVYIRGPVHRSGSDAGIAEGPDACYEVTLAFAEDWPDSDKFSLPE